MNNPAIEILSSCLHSIPFEGTLCLVRSVCIHCDCLMGYACALKCPWWDIYLTHFFSLLLSELLPCVGRLQCQSHKTALSTQVRSSWMVNLDEKNIMQYIQTLSHSHDAVNMWKCIYRTTILAAVAFLDAFQKVADMATNSRGKGNVCQQFNLTHLFWLVSVTRCCTVIVCHCFHLLRKPLLSCSLFWVNGYSVSWKTSNCYSFKYTNCSSSRLSKSLIL